MNDFVPAAAAPSGGAWTYRFASRNARTPALTSDGKVIVPAITDAAQGRPATLLCVDLRTTLVEWPYYAKGEFTTAPTLDGNAIYIGNSDGHLYAINLLTHNDLWPAIHVGSGVVSQPVVIDDAVVFGTHEGYVAVNKYDGRKLWAVALAGTPSRAASSGSLACFAVTHKNSSTINFIDVKSGERAFRTFIGREVSTDPVVVGNVVYFGCRDGQLVGFSIPEGAVVIDVALGRDPLTGPLATDGQYVYAGGRDGNFYAYAVDPKSPLPEWELPVSSHLPLGVSVYKGEAFFHGSDMEGKPYFYTLDLAAASDQTPEMLVESLGGLLWSPPVIHDGRIGFTATGGGSSTIYVFDADESAMLSRVKFSSHLMVGDYDLTGSTPKPSNPEFQILVSVTDENQIAQPDVKVAIWSSKPETKVRGSDAADITLGVTEQEAHYATTDSNGQITLTMEGDLGTPSLYLRPDFFDPGFSLQVFPDQETVIRLSGMQAHAPAGAEARAGLSGATDYSGTPVLKPAYQANVEEVAATIRNTVGAQQNVTTTRLAKPLPSTMRAMSGPAAALTRGIAPGAVPHFIVEFDYEATAMSFRASTPAEIDAMRKQSARFSIGGSLHAFTKEVTKGAKKVRKLTWKHVEEGASRLAHVAADVVDEFGKVVEGAYEFMVETVEQAVEVLKGIIKEVVSEIKAFVEWLSWLFDWDDILKTKKMLKDTVLEGMRKAKEWAASSEMRASVKAAAVTIRKDLDKTLEAAIKALTGKTVSSSQQSVPSKHDAFHPHGVDITSQFNWLIRKLPHPHLVTIDVPGEARAKLYKGADMVLEKAAELLETDLFKALPVELEKAAVAFFGLFDESPEGILKQAVAEVISVFEDVMNLLIDFLIAMIDVAFEAFSECVDALVEFLEAKIDLKFISDLYKLLGGGELRLLDAIALLVAVPTTLGIKILGGDPNQRSARSAPHHHGIHSQWAALDFAAAFSYLLYAGAAIAELYAKSFDGEGPKDMVVLSNMAQGALNIMVSVFGCAEQLAGTEGADLALNVAFFFLCLVSTPMNFLTASVAMDPNPGEWSERWDEWSSVAWWVAGGITLIFSTVGAVISPDNFLGAGGSIVISNIGTSLPFFSSLPDRLIPGKNEDEKKKWEAFFRRAGAVINGLGYGVFGMGTSIAFAFLE